MQCIHCISRTSVFSVYRYTVCTLQGYLNTFDDVCNKTVYLYTVYALYTGIHVLSLCIPCIKSMQVQSVYSVYTMYRYPCQWMPWLQCEHSVCIVQCIHSTPAQTVYRHTVYTQQGYLNTFDEYLMSISKMCTCIKCIHCREVHSYAYSVDISVLYTGIQFIHCRDS